MFLSLFIFILCGVFAIWWFVKPRYLSPPMYPVAFPLIGHAIKILVNPLGKFEINFKNLFFKVCVLTYQSVYLNIVAHLYHEQGPNYR